MRKVSQADTVARYAFPGRSHEQAREFLDAVLDELAGELQRTGHVRLPGFGQFEVKERKGFTTRAPDGSPVVVPTQREVRFRPSRNLTERITGRRPS